ncbi:MAG: asparaginase [Tepidamorphaceae bacterium]|nr:asparaginase [Rhodobiaceae bacterium]MCC0048469.1 asparaginase [Rhodobiaceae bacterium]
MSLPVLVEYVRGDLTESRHHGSIAIAHADGGMLFEVGATEAPVYPRSSVKLLQAMPLVESGGADRFEFSDYELALCCASHSGEPRHVETARGILKRIGLGADNLACGVQWPSGEEDIAAMGKAGETPTRAHNNCSGKHSGMLAFAMHAGFDPVGYEHRDHPVQKAIQEVMTDVFGIDMADAPCGLDGCSLPTLAVPLKNLARGFARLTGDGGIAVERRAAADRLMKTCMREPHAVGGTGKFDTEVMRAFGGRVFLKYGAEAVQVIVFPKLKIAAAVKIGDGAVRATEVVAAAIISRFAVETAEDHEFMEQRERPAVLSRTGAVAGHLQPVAPLTQALRGI